MIIFQRYFVIYGITKRLLNLWQTLEMFLAPAVNTNYKENHTIICHICKKRTSEQNQQILALAATYQ